MLTSSPKKQYLTAYLNADRLLCGLHLGVAVLRQYWKPITVFTLMSITWLSLCASGEATEPPGYDKLQHVIAYAALAVPVALARPGYLCFWLLAILVWSGLIEVIQPFFGREMDAADMLANALGLILGYTLASVLLKFIC